MSEKSDDLGERLLCRIVDKRTTRSFKRTVNTAILLRAALNHSMWPAVPRKGRRLAAFLGLAGLLVGQHVESLRILLHLA
jgi:hypothetical protein